MHHVGTGARIHTIQRQETITMTGVGLPVKARKEKKESQHWILSLRRFLLASLNKRYADPLFDSHVPDSTLKYSLSQILSSLFSSRCGPQHNGGGCVTVSKGELETLGIRLHWMCRYHAGIHLSIYLSNRHQHHCPSVPGTYVRSHYWSWREEFGAGQSG